jgi:hypothetical protein
MPCSQPDSEEAAAEENPICPVLSETSRASSRTTADGLLPYGSARGQVSLLLSKCLEDRSKSRVNSRRGSRGSTRTPSLMIM